MFNVYAALKICWNRCRAIEFHRFFLLRRYYSRQIFLKPEC